MDWLAVALLAAYAASTGYFILAGWLDWPVPNWIGHSSTLFFFGFALTHAGRCLGWRHALAFWAISFAVSLAFETAGVLTGAVYGPYHYGDVLGWKIFGLVPALIPLAWFMMMYSSHVLVNAIAGPAQARSPALGRIVWLSFVGAMAMTAWDLSMDPNMVRWGAWTWEQPGPYFGVPLRNFAGWLMTSFVVFLLYRLTEMRWTPRPTPATRFARLPIAAYAVAWLGESAGNLLNLDPALGLIAFFSMGAFVVAAVTRLIAEG